MIKKSTIQLLRFPFSFFLMPVFWFALSMSDKINWQHSCLLFFVLHVLVYPSSNGYNSLQDQDTGSIGGLETPPKPDLELRNVTMFMDCIALVWINQFLGLKHALLILAYIVFSRLYSFRGIRLKKYPVIGYLTVVVNQGGLIFILATMVAADTNFQSISPILIAAAIFLIGGFYPITQIYQHEQDRADGVTTMSMILGKRGTFIFCGVVYALSFGLLFIYFMQQNQLNLFYLLQIFFLPVIVYFLYWSIQVWKDERNADFKRTMRMNWLASICSNLAFISILIIKHFG